MAAVIAIKDSFFDLKKKQSPPFKTNLQMSSKLDQKINQIRPQILC